MVVDPSRRQFMPASASVLAGTALGCVRNDESICDGVERGSPSSPVE
jgi:hypothetical protein